MVYFFVRLLPMQCNKWTQFTVLCNLVFPFPKLHRWTLTTTGMLQQNNDKCHPCKTVTINWRQSKHCTEQRLAVYGPQAGCSMWNAGFGPQQHGVLVVCSLAQCITHSSHSMHCHRFPPTPTVMLHNDPLPMSCATYGCCQVWPSPLPLGTEIC